MTRGQPGAEYPRVSQGGRDLCPPGAAAGQGEELLTNSSCTAGPRPSGKAATVTSESLRYCPLSQTSKGLQRCDLPQQKGTRKPQSGIQSRGLLGRVGPLCPSLQTQGSVLRGMFSRWARHPQQEGQSSWRKEKREEHWPPSGALAAAECKAPWEPGSTSGMAVGKPVPPEKCQLDFLLEKPQPWAEEKSKKHHAPWASCQGPLPRGSANSEQ